MKLLIVEDHRLLASSLKDMFKRRFIVDLAHTGADALEMALHTTYEVIILDLGLPDIPGQKVCQQLRKQNVTTPILVATATKGSGACVQLLDMGADDYITKPYDREILQARVRALARRSKRVPEDNSIVIDDLIIDPDSRRVERAGVVIGLRKKEFDILEYLARNRGRAVTRDMIVNHAWEAGKESWNNTVDVHVKYLRDKIDKPFKKPLVKTSYGVGYIIEA